MRVRTRAAGLGVVASVCLAGVMAAAPGPPEPVRIGLFLPTKGEAGAVATAVARGARLAADEVNAGPGPGGLRLELVSRPADQQWSAGAREVVSLAYDDRVAAILGGVDGRGAHLAEQIVTRTAGRAVLVTFATDVTLTQVRLPWVYRFVPDDGAQAAALLRYLERVPVPPTSNSAVIPVAPTFRSARDPQIRPIPVAAVIPVAPTFRSADDRLALAVETGDYDATAMADRLDRELPQPAARVAFSDTDTGRRDAADALARAGFAAVVLLGRPGAAGRLAERLSRDAPSARLLAPSRLACPEFLAAAGSAAEGMVIVAPGAQDASPTSPEASRFLARYRRAHGHEAPPIAASAYDAVHAIAAAVARSGGSTHDLAARMSATNRRGASGTIRFDRTGNRVGQPPLLTVRGGMLEPLR